MSRIAAIYVRQSSTRVGDKDVSPEQQEAACRRLPAVAACDVVEVYKDLNRSGQDPTREEFQRFMARITSGEVAVVAAYDGDRIRRNNKIGAEFFEAILANSEITCVMGDGSRFDTSPDGEFDWTLKGAFARKYARDSGLKLSRSHAFRREQGYSTGPAPYGYVYATKPGERWPDLVTNPETAPVVQRIFTTYAEGEASARQIAEALKAEGVTPPISNRNKRNPRWNPDIITGLLCNPAYIAQVYVHGRAARKGQTIAAKWEPLVSRDVFDRVQARLTAKAPKIATDSRRKRLYTFSGMLWCQECGRRMSAGYGHGEVYYRCGSAQTLEPCAMAKQAVRESDLFPTIDAVFGDFLNGIPAARSSVTIETAAVRIANAKRKLVRIGERYEADEITKEEWRAKGDKLRAEIAALESESAAPVDPIEQITLGQQWMKGDAVQRNAVLSALWERIEVRDRKVVKLTARADRASRAHQLIATALQYVRNGEFDESDITDQYGPDDGGPGAARNSERSGKGGIRTLEGALHPLPA